MDVLLEQTPQPPWLLAGASIVLLVLFHSLFQPIRVQWDLITKGTDAADVASDTAKKNDRRFDITDMSNVEAELLNEEGKKLVDEGKYADAAKKFRKAIKLEPACPAIYLDSLAYCYAKMDEYIDFKETAEKCVELDPSFTRGYFQLARAQTLLWLYEDAQKNVEKGLQIAPQNTELLELKETLEEKINARKSFSDITLKAPSSETESVEYFGGPPPLGSFNLPTDTAFSRLHRPCLPPQSRKFKDLSQYPADIRPIFKAFFTGELRINFLAEADTEFQIHGYAAPDDPVPAICFKANREGKRRNGKMISGRFSSGLLTEMNPRYHFGLTNEQKTLLTIGLFQRFIRAVGSQIQMSNSEEMLFDVVKGFVGQCNDRGMYKDAVDLRLALSDVTLCNQDRASVESSYASVAILLLAEALEGAKRHLEAAEIFVELAEHKFSKFRSPHGPHGVSGREHIIRGFAALAFKRAQNYVSAEREYVASLRTSGANLTFTNPDSAKALKNMTIFYETAFRAYEYGLYEDDAHRKIRDACIILVALLATAGFPEEGCPIFKFKKTFQGGLRRKYKSRSKALRALAHSTMAGDIDEYHQRLFKCKVDGFEIASPFSRMDENEKAILREDLLKEQEEISKSCSRGKITQRLPNRLVSTQGKCANCKKGSQDLQECPCLMVKYCCKRCQVAHWPTHKRRCPTRKKDLE